MDELVCCTHAMREWWIDATGTRHCNECNAELFLRDGDWYIVPECQACAATLFANHLWDLAKKPTIPPRAAQLVKDAVGRIHSLVTEEQIRHFQACPRGSK